MFPLQSTQARPIAHPLFSSESPIQKFQSGSQGSYKKKRTKIIDALATLGTCTLVTSGVLSLAIPLINKKSPMLVSVLRRGLPNQMAESSALRRLETRLASRKAVSDLMKRMCNAGMLLLGINFYQTAVNSRQPSLIANALLRDVLNLIMICYPGNFLFSLYTLVQVFFDIGKKTDIDNNNQPGNRREWDFRRLTRFLRPHQISQSGQASFMQELNSFGCYIGNDFRQAFSLRPWKAFKEKYKEKSGWATPQSYQNALAAQLALGSWIVFQTSNFVKNARLRLASNTILLLSTVCSTMPMLMRGWQNKDGMDGRLVLAGVPLRWVGELFLPQFTQKWFFLNGLASIGGPLSVRGLALNSERYREEVSALESLYTQAVQHPGIKASDVLKALNPDSDALKRIEQRLGRHRTQFIIETLQDAEQAWQTQNLPLAAFLKPLAQPHEDIRSASV